MYPEYNLYATELYQLTEDIQSQEAMRLLGTLGLLDLLHFFLEVL